MPTINVDSVEYYYREQGEGPLVILAHSDASSSGQWKGLMEDLQGEFRLAAFDTSGQGRSASWPDDKPYSTQAESAVVHALADSATEPIHLVGHSAGGLFILDAATRLGDRLASLTLVEPVAFFLLRQQGMHEAWGEIEGIANDFRAHVQAGRTEEAMDHFLTYWTGPGSWEALPEKLRAPILTTAGKIDMQFETRFSDEQNLENLREIVAPTLLMRGGTTTLAARTVLDVIHGALPESKIVEIEWAGHLSPITHRDAVNQHIAAHLRSHG